MAREDLQRLALSFIDAFNNADWGRYQDLFAPDATYDEKGTSRTADNRRSGVAILRSFRAHTPGIKGEPTAWVIDETNSTVAVEIEWTRTDKEDDTRVPGTIFFTVRDEKIFHISEQHYYGPRLGYIDFCPITEGPYNPEEILARLNLPRSS
jgi:ketosteroid isomerase-like protein